MRHLFSLLLLATLVAASLHAQTRPQPKAPPPPQRISKFDIGGVWESPYDRDGTFGDELPAFVTIRIQQDGDKVDICFLNEEPMYCSAGQFIEEKLISVTLYRPANVKKYETRYVVESDHVENGHLRTTYGLDFYRESLIEGHELCPERKNGPPPFSFLTQSMREADPTLYRTLSSEPPPECKVKPATAWIAWDNGYKHFAKKEYAAALSCYERAAALGSADAAAEIGTLYEHGFGVAKDLPLAMRWYEAASKGGNSVAAKRVSDLWFLGPGIEHDPAKGLYFATRAYCLGDSEAAFGAHMHYVRRLPGPAPLPQNPELWRLRYIAELGKGQTICELPDVRDQMASQLTLMSLRSLSSRDDVVSLSGLIGLLPNPQTGDTRRVIGVRATQRHGNGEVECEGMFQTTPTEWAFKVNRVNGRRSSLLGHRCHRLPVFCALYLPPRVQHGRQLTDDSGNAQPV